MKVKVIFYAVKDGFAKIKGKVVGFYAELQTLKVTLSVLSANKGRPRKAKSKCEDSYITHYPEYDVHDENFLIYQKKTYSVIFSCLLRNNVRLLVWSTQLFRPSIIFLILVDL